MKRLMSAFFAAALFAAIAAAPASAEFGLGEFDVGFQNEDGTPATQAGSHPFAMSTLFTVNSTPTPQGGLVLDGQVKDLLVTQMRGFVGDPTGVPRCSTADFLTGVYVKQSSGELKVPNCPDASAVGEIRVALAAKATTGGSFYAAVYNLAPPPGVTASLGFWISGIAVPVEINVGEKHPNDLIGASRRISQILEVTAVELTLWGVPGDPAHDSLRGHCLDFVAGGSLGNCKSNIGERPFLTLPRSCEGPLASSYEAFSWQNPTAPVFGSALTHDAFGNPKGFTGCGKLDFGPSITARPTTKAASSPTGLDFSLDVKDEGLTNPTGIAGSDVKEAVVTLPEGFSTNPALAEGLAVCSEAELAKESAKSLPGAGCPEASKIGTVEVETPLLEETIDGSLYIATPYENPKHSLLALYLVLKNPTLGISVTQPLEVQTNPVTGQLTTVAEELPQLPFSHFKLHFREGTRSPLASPPGCGTYDASAVLTPWSGGAPVPTSSAFEIIVGPESGPCPTGGTPPFHPALTAGTINNAAGKYSPFNLRLSRTDSEQEITHFSIKLPPGIVGKLAGIPYCSDAAIAAAKARTGPHGGQEELESPSCPAASEVGRTLVGAGVGPSLAYAPGKIYLAGPYHGSALSIAAITAAKVGPFDLGTVVVRQALKINPETAEVFIDATGSDPIPHIIKGIPVHLRDIRAYVDRPDFVLNPTNCERTSTASTVLGSGLDFGSEADDVPVTVTSPFQAADCASLGFAPKLALSLKGGTKRGDTPAFKALLTYPKGYYANIASAQVTLPHSVFLEQSHIKTICTRVQFAAGGGNGEQCPAASIYGKAKAVTPILSDPLEGPVFLRSSSHNLPDLVAALHNGQINIDLDGRIDSVKGGRIRNTFEAVPDAPVSSFTLEMQGGKKGLLVNSTNLCKKTNKALAAFVGQNGKRAEFEPVLQPSCGKAKKKGKGKAKAKRLALRARW
jgi:hypothetical protein